MRSRGIALRPEPHLQAVGFLAVLLWGASSALAIPAFPGAEGYGGTSSGGRGGDVYHVTSLADTNTVGTLRYGINNAPTSGRTILFDVAGTLALTNSLSVSKNKITIAGQSAPGQGICLKNYPFKINASNVTVRHIRSRLGTDLGAQEDCMTIEGGDNVIVDHVSASWSVDEVLSVKQGATTAHLTVQNCLITEALYDSIHDKGPHSYGSLIRPAVNAWYSWYNNLYADNVSRNPRPGYDTTSPTVVFDFRNNVIYNWLDQAGYTADDGTGLLKMNYVGNYALVGPSGTKAYIFNGSGPSASELQIYQSGNKMDSNKNGVADGTDTGWGMFTNVYDASKMTTPFAMDPNYPAVYTMTADAALQNVINCGGAFYWNRDAADANVIAQVTSYGTAGAIYDTVAEAGGYPTLTGGSYVLSYDTDRDGMPNTWETARGLDPSVANNNGDDDADGYTDLEEYLNWLAPIPAPKAIVWAGGTGRYELITNWDIPWQPTLYDRAEINSGKATVGYIDQEAGTLYVANTAASNAELAVTGGKLTVGNALLVAYDVNARGTISLSGGAISVGDRITLGGPNGSGARGVLNVTGGSLTAGGAIILASSFSSTGELRVSNGAYVRAGGLTINSGSARSTKVAVEVAGDGCSLIRTTAASTLGGVMDVQSLSDYRPREGDKFAVISSTDPNGVYFTGNFTSFTSNITRGLPGSSAFGGAANGSNYELVFVGYTYGDANGDHKVDGGDLALIGGTWTLSGQGWGTCDFSGDGTVDAADLALLGGNWMWSLPPGAPVVSVPEPTTLVLLVACAAALACRKRRHGSI
ncbi:MAG: dockerin type I domain-containing protein [Phycisphaerae bacterium]|nr:dockerin type I domain-containing protein [Phycisphaerae bacterium]